MSTAIRSVCCPFVLLVSVMGSNALAYRPESSEPGSKRETNGHIHDYEPHHSSGGRCPDDYGPIVKIIDEFVEDVGDPLFKWVDSELTGYDDVVDPESKQRAIEHVLNTHEMSRTCVAIEAAKVVYEKLTELMRDRYKHRFQNGYQEQPKSNADAKEQAILLKFVLVGNSPVCVDCVIKTPMTRQTRQLKRSLETMSSKKLLRTLEDMPPWEFALALEVVDERYAQDRVRKFQPAYLACRGRYSRF